MTYRFILSCAPYTFEVSTEFTNVAEFLRALYGSRLIEPAHYHGFIDYKVSLSNTTGMRALVKPQARFLFEGIEPFKPFSVQQGHALIEWGLNWVVSSQEFSYVIIHAAVLATGDKAIVCPALSGSGKSTLAAYLSRNGWRLLSDEMALISPNSSTVTPFVRPICLKNHSIDLAKRWFPDAFFSKVAVNTHKGDVIHLRPDPHSIEHSTTPAQVVGVIFPKYNQDTFLDVYKIDKAGCFQGLTQNAFNYGILGKDGVSSLINIAETSQCFEIHYNDMAEVNRFLSEVVEGE